MNDFLLFIDQLSNTFPIHVQIYYSKIMDWCIKVYKKGWASCCPDSPRDSDDAIICNVQDCDIALAFAKAHVETKKWLLEHNGGY